MKFTVRRLLTAGVLAAALIAGVVVYVASGPAGCPYPYLASLAAALTGYLGSTFIAPMLQAEAARPAPPARNTR